MSHRDVSIFFAHCSTPAMGEPFADGVFVGEHGSRNRADPVGYEVVFVPFRGGMPAGPPVGVTVDPRGALIVADDLSNTVWRIARISE